ncbi:MAG TPA: potassium transporter Kup [Rhizomicrobium sp.]|nr:potassium transporter Kup [Rhizomicrobium sp.]
MNKLETLEPLPDASDPLAGHDTPVGEVHAHTDEKRTFKQTAILTLAALGVVFGDIGTSPIYALRETVLSTAGHIPIQTTIFGALSMVLWALIAVVTLKYVLLIMRADNDGEGGTLALATLAHRAPKIGRKVKSAIGFSAILGLALFYGDGMLTPAISVLGAVEGLGVEAHALEPLVLPASLACLVGLFLLQSRGTAQIGKLFGPLMVLWFIVLSVLGISWIIRVPQVLLAINPWYAINLFIQEPWAAFVALGSVVLAVTGCEALYADMGHFGKLPIRIAWLVVALPALVLNYFGQGASLLYAPSNAHTVFYSMAPHWAHYPLVGLATFAAIIASQAVISGVFSITQQAVQLGQLPRMEIRHTSATDYGQIYVPRMNFILLLGVVLIVLIFKSSGALATAYGIAVTGVMVIDTFNVSLVAFGQWKWKTPVIIGVFGLLAVIDVMFLASNSLKIVEGGWLPLAIAACVFIIMETWRIGRRKHVERLRNESMPLELFLDRADKTPVRVAGTAVFMAARLDAVPGALLHNLKHNKVLHERVVLANVVVQDTPIVRPEKRIEVNKLGKGFYSVRIHHGFFEMPDVPLALTQARRLGLNLDPDTTTFFIGRETLVPGEHPALGRWRTWLYMSLAANALAPAKFYHLPPNRVIELGTQVTI